MADAVLDPNNFIDALSGVVDGVRSSVHGALGTRPHVVELVTRTWSGGRPGLGEVVETAVELDPPPRVTMPGLRGAMRPAGFEEEGEIVLSEVSLSYTEEELVPSTAGDVEFAYRITDAHGQGQRSRYYVPVKALAARGDHAKDEIGWVVTLRRVADIGES